MTAARKKDFERRMLFGLLRQLSIPAEILPGNFESPDIPILLDGMTIGVEVTEIQKSAEERSKRAPQEEIVERAKRDYEALGGPPLSVCFSFFDGADIRNVNRVNLSSWISQFLLTVLPDNEYEGVVAGVEQLPHDLRRYFRELRFWRESKLGIWQASNATWVALLTKEVLQERVDAKKALLPDYLKKSYDAYWLLICAHPINPACRFEIRGDFIPGQISSPFDRTFFYDCWQTIELGAQATRAR